ncbi:unnamed protein product [Peniophora sp. CBMAI 1063]|nr:unnamed protein product [Peniophora sp. CBMAI 1063]
MAADGSKRGAEQPPIPHEDLPDWKKRRFIEPVVDDDEDEDEDEEASETEDDREYETPRPPQWIVRAARDAREFDQKFTFNVVAFWGDNGKDDVDFRVQCVDCPDTFYKTSRILGTVLKEHVKEKKHSENVAARLSG